MLRPKTCDRLDSFSKTVFQTKTGEKINKTSQTKLNPNWDLHKSHTYAGDEILGQIVHVDGKAIVDCQNFSIRFVRIFILKRRIAYQKLVRQHAQTPVVDLFVVSIVVDHFGRQIVQRTAHGLPTRRRRMYTPAKVGNLELAKVADQNVFRFDVSMNDLFLMADVDRVDNLKNVLGRRFVVELARLFQLVVQFTLRRIFEDEEDASIVVKVVEQSKNVGMLEMRLNFNFTTQLVLNVVLDQLRFVQNFQRHNVLGVYFSRQVHVAELALAQRSTYFEIIQSPLTSSVFDISGGQTWLSGWLERKVY